MKFFSVHKQTQAGTPTAALLTLAKPQTTYTSTDQRINELERIHTTKRYTSQSECAHSTNAN